MELHYVLLSLLVAFWLSFFLLFRKTRSDPNHPPGRFGLPIIGENFAFYSAIQKGCSEKFFFDRGWAEGKIFKTSLLGGPTVVLGGAQGNKFVFSNENTFVTSWYQPGLAKLVFATAQDAHGAAEVKKLRKVLPGILKVEILRRNVGAMDEVARRHFAAEWDSVSEPTRFAKRY